MYIGPWQEYRLAKIQDAAVQRLHEEWEQNLKEQLPGSNDDRIRDLMQPLMAKLPSLLLTSKSKESRQRIRKARVASATPSTASSLLSRPSTSISSASTADTRRSHSEQGNGEGTMGRAHNNQETHEDWQPKPRPPRKKKKQRPTQSEPQPGGLAEAVQRRKKMYATWLKNAKAEPSSSGELEGTGATASIGNAETARQESATRLPPIRPGQQPTKELIMAPRDLVSVAPETTHLPPLHDSEWDFLQPYQAPTVAPSDEPHDDDSLDEDAVNKLLNWTDDLLSPGALDASLMDSLNVDEEMNADTG